MTSLRDANLNAKPVTNELFKRSLYAISRSRSSNIVGKPNISNKASLVSDTITGTQTASNTTTKVYHHPWEERTVLSDVYESPITDREHWWRAELKVTPSPGAYDTIDFLSELAKKPRTYAFRDQGRKAFHTVDPGKGALLLPGAYKCTDFLENLTKKPATYRFKAESRDAKDYLNFGIKDKAINVPPNAYLVEGYLSVNGEKAPVKNYMFKSQTKRFPTFIFRPKEGPSPDAYNVKDTAPKMPAVTSCFRSKTPRFHSVHSRVPDPGLYAKTFQHPMPNTISQLGRQHGLFFTKFLPLVLILN